MNTNKEGAYEYKGTRLYDLNRASAVPIDGYGLAFTRAHGPHRTSACDIATLSNMPQCLAKDAHVCEGHTPCTLMPTEGSVYTHSHGHACAHPKTALWRPGEA